MPQFDIHIYAVVRVKVRGVEAENQAAAIARAVRETDLFEEIHRPEAEFSEDISHYLVDIQGDEEYKESQYFMDRAHYDATRQCIEEWHWPLEDGEPSSTEPDRPSPLPRGKL